MGTFYIADNLAASAVISVSGEDPVYTKDNLADPVLAKVFRFPDGTGGWIEFDLGEDPPAYDTLPILGHNFDPAATVEVFAGGVSDPPGPAVASPAYRKCGMWADLGQRSDRYLRVVITDANPSAPTQAGIVKPALRRALPRATRFGEVLGRQRSNLIQDTSRGVRWALKRADRERKVMTWRVLESELQAFRDLEEAVGGSASPFVLIPRESGPDVFYGRLVKDVEYREVGTPMPEPLFDLTLEFEEESAGVEIGL